MTETADDYGHHHEELDMYPELPFTQGGVAPPTADGAAMAPAAGGGPALFYPPADRKFSMSTKGNYANGYPVGAVVHSTEGRSKKGDQDAENTIEGTGIPHNHCYFCISSTGKVYQSFPLNRWGVHCGQTWQSTLGFNLDNQLVGIEVCAAGIVEQHGDVFKPEWSETFTADEVRFSEKVENIQQKGFYHRFNAVQEKALSDLLLWLHANNPTVFKLEQVFGHDEIATVKPKGHPDEKKLGRKQDPGASLSVFMKDFRAQLIAAAATS